MTIRFLFFPFTHIRENQLRIVLTFFPSFEYLSMTGDFNNHPNLHKAFGQGKITPFFLSYDQVVTVEQNLEQYLAWARIHKGNEANLKSLLKDTPYFTNDSDVTAIKTQIKGGNGGKDPDLALPGESTLQQDLLFLKMAQLYDEQNEGIDLALNDLSTSHDKLISTLRGLEYFSSEAENIKAEDSKAENYKDVYSKDAGGIMTQQRIRAWSRSMTSMGGGLKQDGDTPLFITASDAVFDYLESNCKDVVNALDIDNIKVHENECENKNEWQHQFCDYLVRAIQGDGIQENNLPEVNDSCFLSGQIKLCIFSGNDINRLFNCSNKQISVCLIKLK
ncbi:MAG: hypothetical protein H8D87_07770 [Deltaproteobacteria bacterium]|uniref:hypothetical protein n=1 Tax=Desulfobacula sp. TaxID=2593537 RepID=UPI00199FEED1|nr:hypothetical protein [Candidatus Desulfobacula maris]MBL6993279.1 hypothetical protein [Desulfobacula sp.]